jgi:hypothetical protein
MRLKTDTADEFWGFDVLRCFMGSENAAKASCSRFRRIGRYGLLPVCNQIRCTEGACYGGWEELAPAFAVPVGWLKMIGYKAAKADERAKTCDWG